MATLRCQRCGFEATSEPKLLKHWRAELQCPALYSKVKHQELIEQIRPKPTIEQRTCQHCHKEFKSVGGMKTHSHKCKAKAEEPSQETPANQLSNVVIDTVGKKNKRPVNSLAEIRKKRTSYNTIETSNQLHAFDKDIDWSKLKLERTNVIELCRKKAEGIVDLFIELHNNENHENIRWFYDEKHDQYKLIVYNGTKWVDVNHKVITQHLWYIYSFLEEHWCDYQSAIRCDAISKEEILSDSEQQSIDEFYYDAIVDDESVFFHCKDMFYEYMEATKTI
jgi:hypothetical protein